MNTQQEPQDLNFPELPPGYKFVYRGTNWVSGKPVIYGSYNSSDDGRLRPSFILKYGIVDIEKKFVTSGLDFHYWEVVPADSIDPSLSIKEQIEIAKSWVGKTIVSEEMPNVFGTVTGYIFKTFVATKQKVPAAHLAKMIEHQGVGVCLTGSWSNGNAISSVVGVSEIKEYVPAWTSVRINGFHAEKTHWGFRFGEHKFDKLLLMNAKDFIQEAQTFEADTSVKVRGFVFTFDNLEKLLKE
jgi:hypothetical protein